MIESTWLLWEDLGLSSVYANYVLILNCVFVFNVIDHEEW